LPGFGRSGAGQIRPLCGVISSSAFGRYSENRAFTAAIILLLAAGIWANTVIFSFANALLLKSLPIRNPENLYLLQKMHPKQVRPDTTFFYRQFEAIAQRKEVFALLLSWTGLYSVLAYTVARRSRELGIRIAIGAQARHIIETVCVRMMISVGIGLLAGLVCTAALMRLAANLVFGIGPDDPISICGALTALLLCAFFAAAGPAWHAIKADPAIALKAE